MHIHKYAHIGNCVEAFVKYGESLEVMRRVYGTEHPSIAETLKSQASVHEMLGMVCSILYCMYRVILYCILLCIYAGVD